MKKAARKETAQRLIRVRVEPDAKRDMIVETRTGLRIEVREPAAGNRANARVRELLAMHLGLPEASVRLVRGHHASSKTFSVRDYQ